MEQLEWYQDELTQLLISDIKRVIEETKEQWGFGGFTGENEYQTIQLNSMAVGTVKALTEVLADIEEIGNVRTSGSQSFT